MSPDYPQSRNDLPRFLNEHKLLGAGAEIGSYELEYACYVVTRWQGQQLHCIDPWIKQSPNQWRGLLSKRNDWEALWRTVQKLAALHPKLTLHRQFSASAVGHFDDGSLDFVYIDANHAYHQVRDDLQHWWPKVKPGGIFGGHDYTADSGPPSYLEVKPALDTWAKAMGLTFQVTPCTSWWIHK